MGLLAGLAALAQPILARVLLALGMSAVTFTGALVVVDQLKQYVVGNLTAMPAIALQLAGLAGMFHGLSVLFAAFTFALTYWSASRAVQLVGG